jgi:uncharacterized membrane protein
MSEQPNHPGLGDECVECIIGNLLRIGVIASALVVFSGGVLYLIQHGREAAPHLDTFRQDETEGLREPVHIFRESTKLRSLDLIMLGLLLLISTPVARVIFSIAAFALQRDFLYVIFTLIVLCVLVYSILSGYLSGIGAG